MGAWSAWKDPGHFPMSVPTFLQYASAYRGGGHCSPVAVGRGALEFFVTYTAALDYNSSQRVERDHGGTTHC